jgi:hypothetical protein
MEGRAVTDTPIYDQLRLELARGSVQDSPPQPRARTERAPAAKPVQPVADLQARKPVSVWALVNANKKN